MNKEYETTRTIDEFKWLKDEFKYLVDELGVPLAILFGIIVAIIVAGPFASLIFIFG